MNDYPSRGRDESVIRIVNDVESFATMKASGAIYQRCPLEKIVLEHFTNFVARSALMREGPFDLRLGESYATACQLCEADLDALRVGGDEAISIGRSATEVDGGSAIAVAILFAETEASQPAFAANAVSMLADEALEVRQSAWHGLRLANPHNIEPHLRALLRKPKGGFARAAALDILAFHRLPVKAELGDPPDEEGDEIAWLLAEAGGRMPGAWNATRMRQFLGHASSRVREAALRASARFGVSELADYCREAISRSGPMEAIDFLGVVGSPNDLSRLQSAVSNPAAAKAAVGGIGRLGLPESVPFLLDLMTSAELAEPAAAAFWRITGQEAPRGPAPGPPPELTEDELDLWEPQPPVDAPRARDWWQANASRFNPAKRYQLGLNVTDDPLGLVFDNLPLAIRYDVYLRERALMPGTPDWELETWTWKQKDPSSATSR